MNVEDFAQIYAQPAISLEDLVDPEELSTCVDAGLISSRESEEGYLIFNYTDRAMYTPGSWDYAAVRQCRGLIIDENHQVIARPWAKFFNHSQAEAGELLLDAPVEVTNKMDGSLGIVFPGADGVPRVATRGSFESDQAIWASKWLEENLPIPAYMYPVLKNLTLLVEIVYPDNRIVVNYGDFEGLVLLGAVEIATGKYHGPSEMGAVWTGITTEVFPYATLREALEAPPRAGQEGLCVRFLDENRIVKIKQEDYIKLHRLVFGLSRKSVWEYHYLNEDPQFEDFVDGLPDEFLSWATEVWEELEAGIETLKKQARVRLADVLEKLPVDASRREVAAEIMTKDNRIYSSLMFQLLDKKDITPAALKYLKSSFSANDRVRVVDESVA